MRAWLPLLLSVAACNNGAVLPPPPDAIHTVGIDANITQPPPQIDGGQVLVEYVTLDSDLQAAAGLPAGVTTVARVIAFFLDAQTPSQVPFPPAGVCMNLAVTQGWPLIGSPRTELDMGMVALRGPNTAGTIATTLLPKLPAGTDALGRAQDVYYQLVQPNADDVLAPGATYTVNVFGTAMFPDTTFDSGIALPSQFSVYSPALDENGPFVAGNNTTIFWTPGPAPSPSPPIGLIWLEDVDGVPTHVCETDYGAGLFTISGTTLTEYQQIAQARGLATNKLILRRDALVPNIVLLPNAEPNNPRALQLLAITSFEQLVDLN